MSKEAMIVIMIVEAVAIGCLLAALFMRACSKSEIELKSENESYEMYCGRLAEENTILKNTINRMKGANND